MKVLLIEDEFPAAERLKTLIHTTDPGIEILAYIDSVKDGIQWFQDNAAPDLIFADIQLADGLSFEIFEHNAVRSPVIFTTSFDEYALKAFKLKSIDYLLKPLKQSELADALYKFREMQVSFPAQEYAMKMEALVDGMLHHAKRYKTCFLVKHQEELIPVPQKNIAYFYASKRHVCLITREGKQYLVDHTMDDLDRLLDPAVFFHVNRQFITHLASLHKIHTHFNGALKLELLPKPSEEVMVSREKTKLFKEWLEKTEH
jgi:DNA-binding LytR/AlgR family response regulator